MGDERFTVSTVGMAALHAGRAPWMLAKELVANAFDEEITNVAVRIRANKGGQGVWLEVEDDGPGFRDVADAYTLLAPTPKRGDPQVRGRFNLGEKELISVAREATVITVGHTITFPRDGGRKVRRNKRASGTTVQALMPWRQGEMAELANKLTTFMPPRGVALLVQLEDQPYTVAYREPRWIAEAQMQTVHQASPGEPLRTTWRKAALHIHEATEGWLYEMGIPIQPIECPYRVDVQQKVPMPPNRDTVNAAYLQDVYAEVLNAVYPDMPDDGFAESWVRLAVEDDRSTNEAVQAVKEKRR